MNNLLAIKPQIKNPDPGGACALPYPSGCPCIVVLWCYVFYQASPVAAVNVFKNIVLYKMCCVLHEEEFNLRRIEQC